MTFLRNAQTRLTSLAGQLAGCVIAEVTALLWTIHVCFLIYRDLDSAGMRRIAPQLSEIFAARSVHSGPAPSRRDSCRVRWLPIDAGVAVGTALTGGPPHRSQRAELPHWAPASGSGSEAHFREGMLHAGGW